MTKATTSSRSLYLLLFTLTSLLLVGVLLVSTPTTRAARTTPPGTVRFAVIGDYGKAGPNESDVASLVHSWTPDFVVTVGDNSYYTSSPTATRTITEAFDDNVGQYYHDFIYPYTGAYGPGATSNKFLPSMGNHDWSGSSNPHPYVDYFTLPNNERYYDLTQGPVQFFMIDSDNREPDGNAMTSTQGIWLQNRLAASTAPWKLVILHHAPYSSIVSTPALRWPYQQWGASAVLAGHIHSYERFDFDGFPYFVDGLGGDSITPANFNPIPGSVVRYKGDYGAMLVEANATTITYQFFTRTGLLIDTYTMGVAMPSPTPTGTSTATNTATASSTPVPPTSTRTFTPQPTQTPGGPTATPQPTNTRTNTATITPTAPTPPAASPTEAPSASPSIAPPSGTASPTACNILFNDVPVNSTFYPYVRCLVCRGIVSGYPCGEPGEPCPGIYYRPNNNVTRGQTTKIVGSSAGYVEPVPSGQQTFEDVPLGSPFYLYVERMSTQGVIGGYPCGSAGEPCVVPGNRPYFRPNSNVTRGQLSKIVSGAAGWNETPSGQLFEDVPPGSPFYVYIDRVAGHGVVGGYPCGGAGEMCVPPAGRAYFRPNNNASRGQMGKIAAGAFFPNCGTAALR